MSTVSSLIFRRVRMMVLLAILVNHLRRRRIQYLYGVSASAARLQIYISYACFKKKSNVFTM
jgi:hypothetical protein